jgi:hypothetical protein
MIIMKFDLSDANEEEKRHYKKVECRFGYGFEDDISEMIEYFKGFLACIGYDLEAIAKIGEVQESEEEEKEG